MNCFLKLFITCCVFVAFFEFFVTWDSLQTVLDSVKPVARVTKAGNGTGLNSVEVTDADGDIQTTNTNEDEQLKLTGSQNPSNNDYALDDGEKNETENVGKKYYLFALHYDYNGPNVQYGAFVNGAAFAVAYNRTLVEIWFSTHWTSGGKETRFLNETFDMAYLKNLVDVASVEEFKKECNSTVRRLLMHPYFRMGDIKKKEDYFKRYEWKRAGLEKRYKIKLPDTSFIPENSQRAEKLLLNPPRTRCLGILDPGIDTRWEIPGLVKHRKNIESRLRSAPNILQMADDVEKKLCGGDPFMALHWRNRSGEFCGRNNAPCGNMSRIIDVNQTAEVVAKDIFQIMQKRNLSCLYVAVPSFSKNMITILKNAKIPRVMSFSDITTDVYPKIVKIKNDGYITSLLEQEICVRSKTFLGTSHSSWSGFVARQRSKETLYLEEVASWIAPGVILK
ncbi:uncharacterized protein LOC144352391 [Saccoglossus kowalevskii]